MHNVRLLDRATTAELRAEAARIDPDPQHSVGLAARLDRHVLHLSGLGFTAATLLKQALLAVGAEAAISPAVYLSGWQGTTAALLAGSSAQLAAVSRHCRSSGVDALVTVAVELDAALATTDQPARGQLALRDHVFHWGRRTYIMGILNVTPDSFSGDGVLHTGGDAWVARAVAQAQGFVAAGADLIDVGGESTRPGAAVVPASDEQARVVPVIAALRAALPVPLSVDTWKAPVAAAALAAGADLVNDVWGLRLPEGGWNHALATVVAEHRVPLVLMHNRRAAAVRGVQGGHYQAVVYDDLLADICRELAESVAFARSYGIGPAQLVLDPGIGFGKTPAQNMVVLRRLHELTSLGYPLLLGTSRKSFIGLVLDLPATERVEGTAATITLGIAAGTDIIRVHDVAPLVRVARMTDAVVRTPIHPERPAV